MQGYYTRSRKGNRWNDRLGPLSLAGALALGTMQTLPLNAAEEVESRPVLSLTADETAEAATDTAAEETQRPSTTLEIIGSKEAVRGLPGSAYYLGGDEIQQQNYDDINRALRKVPGVYVREEDGYGLFPSISVRGVDTTRSAKLTLMEDGVLIAPAPYSAPEAYMSPTTGRMSGIEILKGSSQIRYGPHITGGAINYLSTPIPQDPTGYVKFLFGTDHDVRVHSYFGDTMDLEQWGKVGYLVEMYYRSNDGFKSIDSVPGDSGGDTGFQQIEPMLKLSWEPDSDVYQYFEFKYGYTDKDANETYLGLSERDFNKDPYRRYAASRFDTIDTYANRTYLRHYIEPTDYLNINTTLYYNDFHRNWYKLNDLRNIDTNGDGVGDGLNMDLSRALAGGNGGMGLEVLKGQRAGDLRVRANDRDYYSYGVQIDPTLTFDTEWADHEVKFGFRFNADRVRRFQHQDVYRQNASGQIVDFFPGAPGSQDNKREATDAVALYVQDKIDFGRLEITPGVRFEYLWQDYEDFLAPATNGTNELSMVGGGAGFTYELTEQWSALGGIYRGFSPPSPGAAVVSGLEEETSLSFEGGLRYQSPNKAFSAEAIGFYTMFDDLIVLDNIGGAGSGVDMNVGRVDAVGLEFFAQYDPGIALNWGFKMPNFVSFTYTSAELQNDSNSTDAESIFAGGKKGNKVPYIPVHVFSIGTGLEFKRLGVFLTGSYVDEVFTTASNTDDELNPAGLPDARFGQLDSHFVVDLSGYYRLTDQAKVLAGVHNLFDEKYAASRHPHGLRPGMPQFFYVGMEFNF